MCAECKCGMLRIIATPCEIKLISLAFRYQIQHISVVTDRIYVAEHFRAT